MWIRRLSVTISFSISFRSYALISSNRNEKCTLTTLIISRGPSCSGERGPTFIVCMRWVCSEWVYTILLCQYLVVHRALVACSLPASVSSPSLQSSGPSCEWGLCPRSQPPNRRPAQHPHPLTAQALAHAGPKHSSEPLTPQLRAVSPLSGYSGSA